VGVKRYNDSIDLSKKLYYVNSFPQLLCTHHIPALDSVIISFLRLAGKDQWGVSFIIEFVHKEFAFR
jgi:hypothetical protein